MSDTEKKCKCSGGKIVDGRCVLPEVTFAAFVMSLNTSALCHLGEIADPESGKLNQNLMFAKHTIDTLNVLKEKTQGNLTDEEDNMLTKFLYDLKMRYVKADS